MRACVAAAVAPLTIPVLEPRFATARRRQTAIYVMALKATPGRVDDRPYSASASSSPRGNSFLAGSLLRTGFQRQQEKGRSRHAVRKTRVRWNRLTQGGAERRLALLIVASPSARAALPSFDALSRSGDVEVGFKSYGTRTYLVS